MFKGRRSIRLRTLLILVAGCTILCGLGMQLYRELSPVRLSARQLQAGNSGITRLNAVATLANAKSLPPWEREEAYRVLLATVGDADVQIRCVAAHGLSRHREHAAEVLTALLSLTKDKAPRARETALFALETFAARGSPEARAVIQAAVSALDDPKPAVRLEACRSARRALIQLGIPAHERDAMIKAMLESMHDSERLEGARLLVQLGQSEQAIPVLHEIATHGSNADRAKAHTLLYESTEGDTDRP